MAINQNTYKDIKNVADGNTHAVLLSGMPGAGKGFAAKTLCKIKLNLSSTDDLDNYPYFKHIKPRDKKITIDQIREINNFFKLKSIGASEIRRALVLEDAHFMNIESQNALLKNLEEPPSDTFIALTSTPTLSLKDTIRSRVQTIQVQPLTYDEAYKVMEGLQEESEKDKYFKMSGGLAGLLYALTQNKEHELIDYIDTAKKIIKSSKYDKLLMVEHMAKNKESIPWLIQAIKIISTTALEQSAQKNNLKAIKRWQEITRQAYKFEKQLASNPNSKLFLTSLMLKM